MLIAPPGVRIVAMFAGAERAGVVMLMRWLSVVCLLAAGISCSQNVETAPPQSSSPVSRTLHPPRDLEGLYTLADYRALKNSFILGLETRAHMTPALMPGQRIVVMDAQGCGSIRHIWQTDKRTPLRFEFFVDGETTPSIAGTMRDLAPAAAMCQQPFVSNAGGIIPKKSYNIYLPIPFEKSMRIEVAAPEVSIEQLSLNFLQIEYRLDDSSLNGVRLRYDANGFRYEGLDKAAHASPPEQVTVQSRTFSMKPGQRAAIQGPGIIRTLSVDGFDPNDVLRIYFDGETTAAVDVRLADLFGPFHGVAFAKNACNLPMPFKQEAQFEIVSKNMRPQRTALVNTEPVSAFAADWGYFHAKSHAENRTRGYVPYPVLFTKGRGQFVGMALFNTGHDHGGADFMVVDGGAPRPDFLHGTNGEDYFGFAWFGAGNNPPYSEAVNNVLGRMRLHLENVVPFRESIEVSWGALENLDLRSVAYWYQDSPADLTQMGDAALGREWEVFGPVTALTPPGKPLPDMSSADALFAALPSEADLDARKAVPIEHRYHDVYPGTFKGWKTQRAVANDLNLMYIYRHVLALNERSHMGIYPRSMMARTTIKSATEQPVTFQLSYDDPLEVRLNGAVVHTDLTVHPGFVTQRFSGTLRAGDNALLVRMLDTANWNTAWAALNLRVLDAQGRELP